MKSGSGHWERWVKFATGGSTGGGHSYRQTIWVVELVPAELDAVRVTLYPP
ncbi:MAG: hypothetical protein A4E42_01845 [Methanoregulaceae archaeon PtaU1.Bin222]|nr:MAG: hypothetical protein A4E42_01845 [Methanoregulaceae archaeon PtaU1.Bin222]